VNKAFLLLLLLLFCKISSAQNPIYYTTKQGLPSNNVYDIKQDRNGFIWIATNRGVVKYDGVNSKVFTIKDGLPNNDVWLLETDNQERIWFLTKSKYQGYIKNDSIHTFLYPDNKITNPYITISDSLVFFSGYEWTYKFENNKLTKYREEGVAPKDHEHKNILGYNFLDSHYISYTKNQIVVHNDAYEFLYTIPIENTIENDNFIRSNTFSKKGLIHHNVYYFITPEGILLTNFSLKKSRYYAFKDLIDTETIKTARCNALPSEIQISVQGHLMFFGYNLELLEKPISFPSHLKHQNSYRDKDGNIWLSNLSDGVTLVSNTELQSQSYLRNKKVQKLGMVGNELYAGVWNDYFYKFNKKKDSFDKIEGFPVRQNVYHIKEDKEENVAHLISSYKIYKFTKKEEQNNASFNISSVAVAKDVNVHNGFFYRVLVGGLAILNLENQQEKRIQKRGLMHIEVVGENIYVAGSEGLFLLKNDSLIKPNINTELLDVSINTLLKNDGDLFVGTNGRGLYIYNTEKIIQLKSTENLAIQKIIKKGEILWLGTNRGVKKVKLQKNNLAASKIIDTFYEPDGLLENNVNDILIQGDTLFVASDMGIARININNQFYKKIPKLYFNTMMDTIHVDHEQKTVAISFSILDYVNQDYFKYEYKLSPVQKKWTATKTKTLNFNNLSPGIYALEVKAVDQHNNEVTKKKYIHIRPLWWQLGWVQFLFVSLGIILFLLILKSIQQKIRTKEIKKGLEERRVAMLELQALRSQMNPHFVYNSLNAIQYYIQQNEATLSENYLSKFARLIRLFFEYSRKKSITLEEEIELLNNYLEIEKLRFEDHLEYTIHIDEELDLFERVIPSMILQPILENAVNHGIFHKEENGHICIDFKSIDANSFQVKIEDDGIGIKKAQEYSKKSVINYETNSSDIIFERLEILNQQREWEITYQVQNLFQHKEASGTQVILTFNQLNK